MYAYAAPAFAVPLFEIVQSTAIAAPGAAFNGPVTELTTRSAADGGGDGAGEGGGGVGDVAIVSCDDDARALLPSSDSATVFVPSAMAPR